MVYSYTNKVGTLKEFLKKIKSKTLSVPDKVNKTYLKSIGYTSSNDFTITRVLKSIGLIDASNNSTQSLRDFRVKSGEIMAGALKKTYSGLFKIYPDPCTRSRDEIEDYFAGEKTGASKDTLGLYIATFNALCKFADFETPTTRPPKDESKREEKDVGKQGFQIPESIPINVNIQLTLPVTDDVKVYENIFKALKECLFTRD